MVKISVITAVYNCQKTIAQAIESVLSQSYPEVESVVIDGASTDGTLAILESFRPRLGKLISEKDRGIYDALNKGIKESTGDIVGFLHSDDLYQDTHVLEKVARAFEDAEVDAVYGDLVYVKHEDIKQVVRYWRSGAFSQGALSYGWMPPHPTFYVRRSVYEQLGGFDTRYRIAADYDTVLRFLGTNKIKVAYVPEILVRMRVGGISNRSLKSIWMKTKEDYLVMKRNRIGGVLAIAWKNLSKVVQFVKR